MTATFGTPLSAALLAVELLLFEFKARSLIPVAFACAAAAAVRIAIVGSSTVFPMAAISHIGLSAITVCTVLGGFASVQVTKLVYWIEDLFDRLSLFGLILVTFCGLKLVSCLIALGSGTSGGTLAPLFFPRAS